MMGKAQQFRILFPFTNKFDLCNHCHGITPYIKAAFDYSTGVSGTRFFSKLVERVSEDVEGIARAQTTEEVLRNWGCDDTQVTEIFQRHPSLRNAMATKLESKLKLLSKLGVTSSDLVKMIHSRPRIINCRLNQNFDERLDHLRSLFGSKELLIRAIVRNPSLLVYKFREEVEPVFELYEKMGVSRHDLISMLLLRPTLIPRTKMCKEKLEYIQRTGINKESKMFKYVVTIIGVSCVETIREKIANIEKFGISEDEVLQFFGRSPLLLTLSVDKVQRNMTFVVGMMKLPASTVLRYPFLVCANLENTLKPRVLLARQIQDMGLEPQIMGPALFRALRMTEKRFLNAFVGCHEKDVKEQLMSYYKASKGIKRLAAASKKHPYTVGFPF
ncbi:hypothetical protein RND81_12G033500 [Saponaria officinalis]|uniref:Uncharacterized protein n=1 Tax=Saponaria officinalis TaxID=3572 RepID=A0AAW1H2W7_SAPOF